MEEQHTSLAPHEEPVAHVAHNPEWWRKYQYDLYDWNDPWFKKLNTGRGSYRIIPLTKGYFMIVDPCDYRRMTRFPDGQVKKWYAKVDLTPDGEIKKGVYGARRGRGDEPQHVYAHREILRCVHLSGVGDHVNGEGLDNRNRANLLYVKHSENGHNAIRKRWVHTDLPRGVERRGKNKQGQQRYGGIRARRLGKHHVKVIRTKRTWLSLEPAARWYRNELKRLYPKRTAWANERKSVTFVLLPPRMESEPVPMPTRKRRAVEPVFEAIPFP